MLRVAVALLALGAVGGLVMIGIRWMRKDNPPAWLTMLHGFLVGAGITLVGYVALALGSPASAVTAFILFAIAGIGGVVLNLGYQQKGRLLPNWLMLVHALVAVAGFVVLCIAAFVD